MCEEWVCAGSGGVVPDLVGEFTGLWLLFLSYDIQAQASAPLAAGPL